MEAERYKHLPHGLLNMAFSGGLTEAYAFEEANMQILKREFSDEKE